jgi:hypothetical protein
MSIFEDWAGKSSRLTKLRESIHDVVTYMTGQLKRSYLDCVPELGEVKLIKRWWCRSPHTGLGVVTLSAP